MEAARTGSVVDVGHGATFGGDVAYVNLLGLDLDLWANAQKVALKQACGHPKDTFLNPSLTFPPPGVCCSLSREPHLA